MLFKGEKPHLWPQMISAHHPPTSIEAPPNPATAAPVRTKRKSAEPNDGAKRVKKEEQSQVGSNRKVSDLARPLIQSIRAPVPRDHFTHKESSCGSQAKPVVVPRPVVPAPPVRYAPPPPPAMFSHAPFQILQVRT